MVSCFDLSHLALRDPWSILLEVLIPQLLLLLFLLFLAAKMLQPPLLSICQPRWAPPRLKVLLFVLVLGVSAAGLMIIGQHKFLRSIDRFLNNYRSLLCILNFAFAILNLHSIGDWCLPRINMHWLRFVLLLLDAIFLALRKNLSRSQQSDQSG